MNHWGLNRRKQIKVEGDELWLASIEYVILRKLEYYQKGGSEKHLRDIAGILSVSSDQIDFKVLDTKIKELLLEKEWATARNY